MTPLIQRTWEAICVGAEIFCKEDEYITTNISANAYDLFQKNFKELYNDILNNYMENQNNPLDRHKVAAIIIISIIKAEILKTKKENSGLFMGNYILAVEVGLSYMLGELNEKLKEHEEKEINLFLFPNAISCNTNYFRILYRNLYYANNNKKWGLNPLDIAERLFLIEYRTLEKNGINPDNLKEC